MHGEIACMPLCCATSIHATAVVHQLAPIFSYRTIPLPPEISGTTRPETQRPICGTGRACRAGRAPGPPRVIRARARRPNNPELLGIDPITPRRFRGRVVRDRRDLPSQRANDVQPRREGARDRCRTLYRSREGSNESWPRQLTAIDKSSTLELDTWMMNISVSLRNPSSLALNRP